MLKRNDMATVFKDHPKSFLIFLETYPGPKYNWITTAILTHDDINGLGAIDVDNEIWDDPLSVRIERKSMNSNPTNVVYRAHLLTGPTDDVRERTRYQLHIRAYIEKLLTPEVFHIKEQDLTFETEWCENLNRYY